MLAERGDIAEAARLLEQSLIEDPHDEAALLALCDLADRLPSGFGLADRLSRVLAALPPPSDQPAVRARRARLWQRHGELARARDPGAAITAFQEVVSLEPDSLPAREALAALYDGLPGHEDAAADNHRRLLAADITRAASLRALAVAYTRRGLVDRARCCNEVLALLGEATRDEEAFLRDHPQAELKPDDPYATAIDDRDRDDHLALPEATQMAEIFSCLWEGAPGLIGQRLEDFGVSARDKVSPMSDLDLGKIYGQVAKALANKKTALYVRPEGASSDVTIVVQAPPALLVGARLAADAPAAEVRFQLARGIELSRPEYILAAGVRPQAVHAPVRQRAQGLPPAPRAPPRHRGRRRRGAGGQAQEERPVQGVEAAGLAVPGPRHHVLELGALARRRPPRREPHRAGPLRGPPDRGADRRSARAAPSAARSTPEEIRQLAEPLRAAARAPALRGQRGLLRAAREARHLDRQGRRRLSLLRLGSGERLQRAVALVEPREQRVDVVLKRHVAANVTVRDQRRRAAAGETMTTGVDSLIAFTLLGSSNQRATAGACSPSETRQDVVRLTVAGAGRPSPPRSAGNGLSKARGRPSRGWATASRVACRARRGGAGTPTGGRGGP